MKKLFNSVRAKGVVYLGLIFAVAVYLFKDESSTEAAIISASAGIGIFIIVNFIDYVQGKAKR